MDGNVSKAGLTHDLEALSAVGVGETILFQVGDLGFPSGPADYLSPAALDALRHVAEEARHLGIKINIHNGAGWSGSGGPWIAPEEGMQELVWREQLAEGPAAVDVALPENSSAKVGYKDVACYLIADEAKGEASAIARLDDVAFRQSPAKPLSGPVVEGGQVRLVTGTPTDGGSLRVEVPSGRWRVLRLGQRASGRQIHPVSAGAKGATVDPLDSAALDKHWERGVRPLIAALSPSLAGVLVDSWEMGPVNWGGPNFAAFFKHRRGYDPMPWMPVISGRIIGDKDRSERFLWDLRKTVAEAAYENYAGHIATLAAREGLRFLNEPYGHVSGADVPQGKRIMPMDGMEYGGLAEVVLGEFWQDHPREEDFPYLRTAVSIRNLFGKQRASAEAFTSGRRVDPWDVYPGELKRLGDPAFCEGINHFTLHAYVHQPFEAPPGLTLGQWGQYYQRLNPWFLKSRAWVEYLSRCQALLQSGRPRSDVLVLMPDDVPTLVPRPEIPHGYAWDMINVRLLQERIGVSGHALKTPEGLEYRLLIVPDLEAATPALLSRLLQLAESGATISLGKTPGRSPSLSDWPKADEDVRRLVEKLWGGERVADRKVGAGRVLQGLSPAKALAVAQIAPRATVGDAAQVNWIQRSLDDGELFFVANDSDKPESVELATPSTYAQAEIWDPQTGRRHRTEARAEAGRVSVPVWLPAHGSTFVVLREKAGPNLSSAPAPSENVTGLTAPWSVRFEGPGAPKEAVVFPTLFSWSEHPDEAIRYFGGTAVYTTSVDVVSKDLEGEALLRIELGNVRGLASVEINGRNVGTLWSEPWRTDDIRALLQAGENTIRITVAGGWYNRLIGDLKLAPGPMSKTRRGHVGYAEWPDWLVQGQENPPGPAKIFMPLRVPNRMNETTALRPIGLLGPVRLTRDVVSASKTR